MEKITGMEAAQDVPPKVLAIYEAVEQLIAAGEDINSVKVLTITELAGIGKGTAYDYFDTKDDIIACSLLYQIRMLTEGLREIFSGEESFAEQIAICMDEIEKKNHKQQSFLRYVHIMTANSGYCRLVKEKMKQPEFQPYLPMSILKEAVERGRLRGEIRRELSAELVVYAVFSKLMTYMVSVHACEEFCAHPGQVRPYLFESLIKELS